MSVKFHHVGMVVPTQQHAERLAIRYCDEVRELFWEAVPEYNCWCAFSRQMPMLEFVVPAQDSKLAAFLGAGFSVLHHIAFEVPDIADYMAETRLLHTWLSDTPARGARGLWVNFARPNDGLLVEYVSLPVIQ